MSMSLYSTGIQFYKNKRGGGIAKLHGEEKRIDNPPSLLGGFVDEVEYVPEVAVMRLRKKFEGWRDMERDEIQAMDAWLRMKLGPVKKSYE